MAGGMAKTGRARAPGRAGPRGAAEKMGRKFWHFTFFPVFVAGEEGGREQRRRRVKGGSRGRHADFITARVSFTRPWTGDRQLLGDRPLGWSLSIPGGGESRAE